MFKNIYASMITAGILLFSGASFATIGTLQITSAQPLNFVGRVGSTQTINVTLTETTNTGDVTVECIQIPEDINHEFSGIPAVPLTVHAGQSTTFGLIYTPSAASVTSPAAAKNYTLTVDCLGGAHVTQAMTGTAYEAFPIVMSETLPVSALGETIYPTTYDQNFIIPQLADAPVTWNLRFSNISNHDVTTSNLPTITNYSDNNYDAVKWSLQAPTAPITIPANSYIDIPITVTPVNYIDSLTRFENARINWDLQLSPLDPVLGTDVSVHRNAILGKLNPNPDAGSHLIFTTANNWTQGFWGAMLTSHSLDAVPTNGYSQGLMIPSWTMLLYITDMRVVGQGHEDFDIAQNTYNGQTSFFGTYNATDKSWSNFAIGNSAGLYYLQNSMNAFGAINLNFTPQPHPAGYYSNLYLQLTAMGFSQPFQIPITVNSTKQDILTLQ